jgi:hypothetical protein
MTQYAIRYDGRDALVIDPSWECISDVIATFHGGFAEGGRVTGHLLSRPGDNDEWTEVYPLISHTADCCCGPCRQRRGPILTPGWETLDSGERIDFPSGMRRDTDAGKPRFDLIPLPMLRRLADLYARGAEKYGDSNWQLADSDVELARFKASGFRHFISWLEGDQSEDHAVATVFNIFAAETIAEKLANFVAVGPAAAESEGAA